MLCLTEALVTRAVSIKSFKHVYSINDKFFNNFIFLVNIGFSFVSNLTLYSLGNHGLGTSDELLTGRIQKDVGTTSFFYEITFGINFVICCVSSITIAIQKYIAYKNDKDLVKNINIMINQGTVYKLR